MSTTKDNLSTTTSHIGKEKIYEWEYIDINMDTYTSFFHFILKSEEGREIITSEKHIWEWNSPP